MAEATEAQIKAEKLLNKLWNDATAGDRVRKLAKEEYPETKIVDDIVAPFVAPLEAQNKALQARLDKIEEERAKERAAWEESQHQTTFQSQIEAARRSYSLTDEGFNKMLDRMKEQNNPDAEAAAAWVASKTPAPIKGPTWAPQDLNLFGSKTEEEGMRELHNDPVGYQDRQIAEFLKNPDKFVSETLGG
jgi:hypothetical protein